MSVVDPTKPGETLTKLVDLFNQVLDSTDDSAPKQVRSGLEKAAQESLLTDETAHLFAEECDNLVTSTVDRLFAESPAAVVFLEDLFADLAKRIKNEADYQIHLKMQEMTEEDNPSVEPADATELQEWVAQAEQALDTFESFAKMMKDNEGVTFWDRLIQQSETINKENEGREPKDIVEPPLKKTEKRGWSLNTRRVPSELRKDSKSTDTGKKRGRRPIIQMYRVNVDGQDIPDGTDLHYVAARMLGEPGEYSYRDILTAWQKAVRGSNGDKELHATPGTEVKFALGTHLIRMYVPAENK